MAIPALVRTWRSATLWLGVGLAALGLVACRPIGPRPASPPEPEAAPAPVEIRYSDGSAAYILEPDDAAFATAHAAFVGATATVVGLARTFFDAERFAAEVATVPNVHARYAGVVGFTGQGVAWDATELVAVVVGADALILARSPGLETWSVYLVESPQTIVDLLDTVAGLAQGE